MAWCRSKQMKSVSLFAAVSCHLSSQLVFFTSLFRPLSVRHLVDLRYRLYNWTRLMLALLLMLNP